jgi:hypothetical protein
MESLDSTAKLHGLRQQLFGVRESGTPKVNELKGEGEHKRYSLYGWLNADINQTCRPSPNDMVCASLLHYWAR